MKACELSEARKKAEDIAEILGYLKSLGYDFEGEEKGYLKCLMSICKSSATQKLSTV